MGATRRFVPAWRISFQQRSEQAPADQPRGPATGRRLRLVGPMWARPLAIQGGPQMSAVNQVTSARAGQVPQLVGCKAIPLQPTNRGACPLSPSEQVGQLP